MTEPDRIPSPDDERSAGPRLGLELAVLIGIGLALIYAAGWAYAYRWYGRFDLGINGLGLPVETVLMYGFWTLTEHIHLLLFAVAGSSFWGLMAPASRRYALLLSPLVLFAAFALAYGAGRYSADERFETHRDAGFRCLPVARVGLIPSSDRPAPLADLARQLAERGPDPAAHYRLLLQTDSLLVLIKPKPQGPPVPVLVPMARVDAVRLTSVVAGCD